MKIVYCLTRKTQRCNSLVQSICMFLQKEKSHYRNSSTQFNSSSTMLLATSFTRKMPESSDSMYSSIFTVENIWYHHFTWSGTNSQEIVNFLPIMTPRGPKLNWNKIYNFLWIRSTSAKMMVSYAFWYENGGIHGIWAFWHFSSKTGHQIYSA